MISRLFSAGRSVKLAAAACHDWVRALPDGMLQRVLQFASDLMDAKTLRQCEDELNGLRLEDVSDMDCDGAHGDVTPEHSILMRALYFVLDSLYFAQMLEGDVDEAYRFVHALITEIVACEVDVLRLFHELVLAIFRDSEDSCLLEHFRSIVSPLRPSAQATSADGRHATVTRPFRAYVLVVSEDLTRSWRCVCRGYQHRRSSRLLLGSDRIVLFGV
jgi:hypothetical protein